MIPKSAEPIAKVIREQVPRPKTLPERQVMNSFGLLCLRWPTRTFSCCPMGLLSDAIRNTPASITDFKDCYAPGSTEQIKDFGDWWDAQTDPTQAVEDVWGKE